MVSSLWKKINSYLICIQAPLPPDPVHVLFWVVGGRSPAPRLVYIIYITRFIVR
jgi:hypothetical protein